jgi:hypothetical protein
MGLNMHQYMFSKRYPNLMIHLSLNSRAGARKSQAENVSLFLNYLYNVDDGPP